MKPMTRRTTHACEKSSMYRSNVAIGVERKSLTVEESVATMGPTASSS